MSPTLTPSQVDIELRVHADLVILNLSDLVEFLFLFLYTSNYPILFEVSGRISVFVLLRHLNSPLRIKITLLFLVIYYLSPMRRSEVTV